MRCLLLVCNGESDVSTQDDTVMARYGEWAVRRDEGADRRLLRRRLPHGTVEVGPVREV
jgi:hypothetical protein